MKNVYHTRLLKLARHLGNQQLRDLLSNKAHKYYSVKGDCKIECFYWVFREFPKVFYEWKYNEEGVPYLKNHPEMNSITSAAFYLNLSMDSLFHLFVSGYQMPDLYYGKHLEPEATPSDISSNLYEFIRHIEEVEASWAKFDEVMRSIILTPVKINRHERNKNKLSEVRA